MRTLIKWGVRAYMLIKFAKIIGLSTGRSPQENLKALTSSFTSTKGALIALSNFASPGASINPAKQQARDQARGQVPVVRTATTALLGAAGTDALRIGDWMVQQDDDGNLTAATDDGQPQIIANATAETPTNLNGAAAADDGKKK